MSPGQRGTAAQQARRVNAAAALLAAGRSVPEAARELARRFRVSLRQARRYAEQARAGGTRVVPPAKVVFTVKLPVALVQQLRRHARQQRRALSVLVEWALERFLSAAPPGRPGGD